MPNRNAFRVTMRPAAAGCLALLLFAGCHGDSPVDLSADSPLQYDAVMTDSTDEWTVAVTATNVGETPVTFRISGCNGHVRVLDRPGGRVLFPDGPISCFAIGPTTVGLRPGESRVILEPAISWSPTLREQLAGHTYWIQAALIPASFTPFHNEKHIDIGWVHLTQPGL